MEPVRIGIIGCGVIGTIHIRTAVKIPLFEVIAVADIIEDKAKKVAEEYKIKKFYSTGEELLKDSEIEGVILAVTTNIRTDLALKAFKEGKHVLLEKPAGMNVEEIYKMIEKSKGLVVGSCSSRYRFLDHSIFVTDFLKNEPLGNLRVIRSKAIISPGPPPKQTPPLWRVSKSINGGGILVNWGVYDLDYLLGITNWKLKPKLIIGKTWEIPSQFSHYVAPGSDAEEHFAALILFENGTIMFFERGECVPSQTEEKWEITGEKGTLHLKMTVGENKKIIYDDGSDPFKRVVSNIIWEGNENWEMIFERQLINFAKAIRGEEDIKTDLQKALIIQKITDGIYLSSEKKISVEIS
ncbi:MAG: Gfo/Idh/MocA family protein [Candidatus Ratteibacteria bacterium]